MPRKRCSPHSQVQVGCVHSWDRLSKKIKQVWQLCHIPLFRVIVEKRARHVGSVHGIAEIERFPVFILEFLTALCSPLLVVMNSIVEVFESFLVNLIVSLAGIAQTPSSHRCFSTFSTCLFAVSSTSCLCLTAFRF